MKNKNKYPIWFYLFIIVIPIIFIVLLELSLWLFNYGKDLKQWTEITEEELILNPDIGARYFSNIKNYPHSNHDPFDKIKQDNAYRIFIFGGSSAAGFPYQPNGSFSRYLRDRLQIEFPDIKIEVINLAITAVNSITIRDLLPGAVEKKPDLVIIYAGHNEYYGALGVGSTESISGNQFIIDSYLYLQKFRITQLIKNSLGSLLKLFSENNSSKSGNTLMARMADDKTIRIDSDNYNSGISQFEDNLDDIFTLLANEKIPTLTATLPCNLLDQKPFYSFDPSNSNSAIQLYNYGRDLVTKGKTSKADSILKIARDLDGLRFRAPSAFNEIIINLSERYSHFIVDIEEGLTRASKNSIIGKDLMVDHLHPTLEGQFIIGKLFFEEMIKNDLLPRKLRKPENNIIHERVVSDFAFSSLDSTAAEFRIKNLLNDWPFLEQKNRNWTDDLQLKTKIDTIALKIVKENYNWESAHQDAYKFYLSNGKLGKFIKEIEVLISQYPFKLSYYNYAAEELIKRKSYKAAEKFLNSRYEIQPDLFSTKWLGNINLFNNKFTSSIEFLNESLEFDKSDPQIYYNLAIAHLRNNDLKKCISALENCLRLKPDYTQARKLLNELNKKAGL